MIKKIMINITNIIIALCSIFVFVVVFFTQIEKDTYMSIFTAQNYISEIIPNILLLIGFIFCIVLYLLFFKNEKTNNNNTKKSCKWFWTIGCIALFILQVVVAYYLYFIPGNDAGVVREGALLYSNGQFDDFFNLKYYQQAPNNVMLYAFYVMIYKVSAILDINAQFVLVLLSVIETNIATLMASMCVWEVTRKREFSYITFIIGALLFGLQSWIVIPYTDSLSIIFPIVSFYVFLKLKKHKDKIVLKWIMISIIPIVTYSLKALNIIILFAMILAYILHENFTFKELIKAMIGVLLAFILSRAIYAITIKAVDVTPDDNRKLDVTWYLLLGSNYYWYGQFNGEDASLVFSYDNVVERDSASVEMVKNRITDMGIKGIIKHWNNKSHVFYNDPTFGWGVAFDFIKEIPVRDNFFAKMIRNFYYPVRGYGLVLLYQAGNYGQNYGIYVLLRQIMWIPVVFLMLFYCIINRNKNTVYGTLSLTFVGLFFFAMLFESSSRLYISYLPLFIVMSCIAFQKLIKIGRKIIVKQGEK